MTTNVSSHESATLDMPFPRLSEGRFSSCTLITDDALYAATGVRIGFTQRTGGTSLAPYDSLNLGGHVGDDPAHVKQNRATLLAALGAADAACIQPHQVHGDVIVTCRDVCDAKGCADRAAQGADAVVVACPDTAALLCFADCVPVIVVAPTGAFAVVHAGWRGVAARIAEKAVARLCEEEGVAPSQLNVYIGPHIRSCHFEVGTEVAQVFSDEFGDEVVLPGPFVDMAKALRTGLQACGVDGGRIVDAQVCTVCDAGRRYYSYRASKGCCGRHAAVAVRVSDDARRADPWL